MVDDGTRDDGAGATMRGDAAGGRGLAAAKGAYPTGDELLARVEALRLDSIRRGRRDKLRNSNEAPNVKALWDEINAVFGKPQFFDVTELSTGRRVTWGKRSYDSGSG